MGLNGFIKNDARLKSDQQFNNTAVTPPPPPPPRPALMQEKWGWQTYELNL